MAIQHAVSGEPVRVLPPTSTAGERQTVALFKTHELEVMRVVLSKGKSMPPAQGGRRHHSAVSGRRHPFQ